jgi:hypothetical protein
MDKLSVYFLKNIDKLAYNILNNILNNKDKLDIDFLNKLYG